MVNLDALISLRRQLHQIPELGFEEIKTQAFLLEYINGLPQEQLEIHRWRTGLIVKVKGTNPSKTIGYRTDIDGLPINEETSYDFKSVHKGMMHACGHDVHMTIALGLLTHFASFPVSDHLLFLFQPAEEGPGGAQPLLESEIFQSMKPDIIVALHIAPEYPVGTIATKEGLLFANTSELFIDLKGIGGHAAYPHLANDMVVAASYLVTQLQSIVARNVDPLDSAVITIGKIEGGTKQNIIAEHARIEGTIRTLSIDSMQKVKSRIESVVSGIASSFECQTAIDYGANYRQVDNDSDLTKEFMAFCNSEQDVHLVECREAMTGEDYGYFLEEIPGFMFWLGVDSVYGLHSSKLEPDEASINVACRTLIDYLTWKATK
jgi:N-acetyldiaminopimelate deacetylase